MIKQPNRDGIQTTDMDHIPKMPMPSTQIGNEGTNELAAMAINNMTKRMHNRHNSKPKPNNRQNWSSSSLKQPSFRDRLKSP